MARATTCTLESLQTYQGCFSCLSKSERLHLKIWFMMKLYEALGQTLPTIAELTQLAACFKCESETALDAFEVGIWQNAASVAGATVDGVDVADLTIDELKLATKCYPCADPKLFKAAYMYGLCVLMGVLVTEN